MQVAHSSSSAVGLPFADLVAEELFPVVARVEDAVAPVLLAPVLLAGRLATRGPLEPPHATSASAAAATSAASPRPLIAGARRRLIGRGRWVLCRIAVSFCRSLAVSTSVLRERWFPPGFLLLAASVATLPATAPPTTVPTTAARAATPPG
jgi:hypothetical protein